MLLRSTRGRTTLVGLVATLLLCAVPTAAAVEAEGIRLDPAEDAVLGPGQVLRPALPPGAAVGYQLVVRNLRDEEVEVLVYGADVVGGEVGPGTDAAGVGSWITTDPDRTTLAPDATAVVVATVARPADAEEGGTGAVVVQLAAASREALGLDVVRRAALLVEVAADGRGDGVTVAAPSWTTTGGLLARDVVVQLALDNPGDDAQFDAHVLVARPLGDDARVDATPTSLAAGASTTADVTVDLPWWGFIGTMRGEVATPGRLASSAPVRVVVIPPWAVLALVAAAGVATLRARRQ